MILTDDRTELDEALADDDLTLLLLSGSEDSRARIVDRCLDEENWEDWYRSFLITDFNLLTDEEIVEWFDVPIQERYAVLGGDSPKKVASKGEVVDYLTLPNKDKCDRLNTKKELAKGDVL
jgi:hypothetical protein